MLSDLEWHRFALGDIAEPVTVCRVPAYIVSQIGAANDRLQLAPSYSPKFLNKHGMTPRHFPMIEIAVRFGTAIANKPGAVSFFFEDGHVFLGTIFHVAVKVLYEHNEMWVVTFHKIYRSDMNRRIKKSRILHFQE